MAAQSTELTRERLLIRALESASDLVAILDTGYRLQYVNRAFEELTGCRKEEVQGRSGLDEIRAELVDQPLLAEIITVVSQGSVWAGPITSRTKDGRLLTQEVIISPIRDDAGEITNYVAVGRPVGEQKELTLKLMWAERLAAVGQLAAGVAHEINNPLAYILANVNFLSEEHEQLSPTVAPETASGIREALADLQQGVLRIRDIVKDLSAFSGYRDDDAVAVDVSQLIDSTLKLLLNEIKHRARLIRSYGDVPQIWGPRSRLVQVFFNLLLNSAQAIDVGEADKNEIRIATRTDATGCVVVTIVDTGSGIDPAALPRVFDPFFTTHTGGDRTGMGLAVCHTVVTSLGGSISISSEPGKGTTCTVTLPPSKTEPKQTAPSPSDKPVADSHGIDTILVVDDEPGVLRAVKRLLAHCEVETCLSGREALDRIQKTDYSLIFCDLMMPELTGMDVYKQATAAQPELKGRFVFMTGGAFTREAQAFVDDSGHTIVEKPFDARALRQLVGQRLAKE